MDICGYDSPGTSQKWNRKGVDLDTLFPDPNLDQDFSVGLEGEHYISANGNRVAVSGMETVPLCRVDDEKFFCHIATFEWEGGSWRLVEGTVETPAYPAWLGHGR